MRFLIDANLPRAAVALLARLGHQAEFARDIGLGAASDETIAAHAQRHAAVLVTRDLDFSDVRRYPPQDFNGIVVLRVPETAVANEIVEVLARFLSEPSWVDHISGRLAVVESDRVRFRPPL